MNWDTGNWDSGNYDASPPVSPGDYFDIHAKHHKNTTHISTAMKRQNYYPSRIGDQVNWTDNLAVKLPLYGTTLGLTAPEVTAMENDAKWVKYVLGTWLTGVRAYAVATTDAVDEALSGVGAAHMVLPTFTAPAPPAGVTAPPADALPRIFNMVARMKLAAGYTDAIGADLAIVGSEDGAVKPAPKFSSTLKQGAGCQCVSFAFSKYGHMGVHIESRRGAAGVWEFLAVDTESPYMDERPLLVAGQPEVREYRMRFWDKGTANGDWTDVASVTVSP